MRMRMLGTFLIETITLNYPQAFIKITKFPTITDNKNIEQVDGVVHKYYSNEVKVNHSLTLDLSPVTIPSNLRVLHSTRLFIYSRPCDSSVSYTQCIENGFLSKTKV